MCGVTSHHLRGIDAFPEVVLFGAGNRSWPAAVTAGQELLLESERLPIDLGLSISTETIRDRLKIGNDVVQRILC